MASKKLHVTPFDEQVVEDDVDRLSDMPDEALTTDKSLDVTDDAYAVSQSESFVQEEKTLAEKELEQKQKMGREVSGQTDLEEERETKRVQVEQNLDSFEKERVRVQKKRLHRNVKSIEQASQQQLKRMRAIQADYIAKAGNLQDTSDGVQAGLARTYAAKQEALMYDANSVSNLISMSINDALMNSGKDKTYEEDHVGEKQGFFGPKRGRQKTIVVNGATVMVDEDVAEVIQTRRSPILRCVSKKLSFSANQVSGETAKEIANSADAVLKDAEVVMAEADDVSDSVAMAEVESQVQTVADEKMAALDAEGVEEQADNKESAVPVVAAVSAAELAEQRYKESSFAKLERRLEADRRQMQYAFVKIPNRYQKSKYEYVYDKSEELSEDGRQVRELPEISWGMVMYDDAYLPDGRPLPYIDYSDYERQRSLSL